MYPRPPIIDFAFGFLGSAILLGGIIGWILTIRAALIYLLV